MKKPKKEIVIYQIEDMLRNCNRERVEEYEATFENGAAFLELMDNILLLLKESD